ncbi:MAG: GIY-YIG nuclease family protein [Pseudodesulfovibrio sp.]|nr:GIY-YIG nuclease family protein [Pseudodesulfovibrio sp.]
MQSWFVYLLRCADDSLYCGITTDVDRRLAKHNAGTASKYTRSRLPVFIETHIAVENKSEALKLEIRIKKQGRAKKISYLNELGQRPPNTLA